MTSSKSAPSCMFKGTTMDLILKLGRTIEVLTGVDLEKSQTTRHNV